MEKYFVIKYNNKSYIVKRDKLESSEQFYHRAWLIAKDEPSNQLEYKKSILKNQKKINEKYLGYVY